MAEGQACDLPLKPATYAPGDEAITIELPDIPAILEPFLKGTIQAQVTNKKPDGTPVSCLEVMVEIAWINVTISQSAEAILNKISNNIKQTYIGLISVLQGFQKCIAWNPSK